MWSQLSWLWLLASWCSQELGRKGQWMIPWLNIVQVNGKITDPKLHQLGTEVSYGLLRNPMLLRPGTFFQQYWHLLYPQPPCPDTSNDPCSLQQDIGCLLWAQIWKIILSYLHVFSDIQLYQTVNLMILEIHSQIREELRYETYWWFLYHVGQYWQSTTKSWRWVRLTLTWHILYHFKKWSVWFQNMI